MISRAFRYCVALVALTALSTTSLFAQADGQVDFSVTTATYGGAYKPAHVLAIWVTDASGTFVKTLKRQAWGRRGYLTQWVANSEENAVDAITGATLTSHQAHNLVWDCTDVDGSLVPDGVYRIRVEFTEDNGTGKITPDTHIQFTKGPTATTVSPVDLPYFKSMSLDWTPAVVLPTYALTITSGTGSGNYTDGAVVNIDATAPAAGKEFDAWTGDTSGVADANNPSTTVTMSAAAAALTATYKDLPLYALTINGGTGDGNYTEGTIVPITADTAPGGQEFDAWTGDTVGVASTIDPATTVTMPGAAATLTATYMALTTIIPFQETFETGVPMADQLGPVHRQHGWVASPTDSGVVTNSEHHKGAQSVMLAGGSLQHIFTDSKSNVWTELYLKNIQQYDSAPEVDTDSTAAFYFNTNAAVVAYNSTTPVELSGAVVPTNDWVGFLLHFDYGNRKWSLWQDNVQIVTNFDFYSGAQSSFNELTVHNGSTGGVYVDDVLIAVQAPDKDSDGMPDWWELIAGTDSEDPESRFVIAEVAAEEGASSGRVIRWNSSLGRLYSIQWATNLVPTPVFVTLDSDMPPTPPMNTYTDSVHAAEATGFYRIGVKME